MLLHARLDGIRIKLQDIGNLILLVALVISDSTGFASFGESPSIQSGHHSWHVASPLNRTLVIDQGRIAGGFQTAANTFRTGAPAGGRFRPLDGDTPASVGEQAKEFRPVHDGVEEFGTVYPGQGAGDFRLHRQFRPLEKRSKTYEEFELESRARDRLPPPVSPYPVESLPGSGLPGGFRPQWQYPGVEQGIRTR